MMQLHRNAAMAKEKAGKKAFPVSTTKVHEWLKGYLGNSAVEWIDGNTLILWNSPFHKQMMTSAWDGETHRGNL
jgi:hypothetical protein